MNILNNANVLKYPYFILITMYWKFNMLSMRDIKTDISGLR